MEPLNFFLQGCFGVGLGWSVCGFLCDENKASIAEVVVVAAEASVARRKISFGAENLHCRSAAVCGGFKRQL